MEDQTIVPEKSCFSLESLDTALRSLPGWEVVNGKLKREFKFGNFVEAFAFMTKAALISEKLDHHPDWSNSYGRVVIELFSHDQNAITNKDIIWAQKVSRLLHLDHLKP